VTFTYSPDGTGLHPRNHLRGLRGILQADGYAGFEKLYDEAKPNEGSTLAGRFTQRDRPRKYTKYRESEITGAIDNNEKTIPSCSCGAGRPRVMAWNTMKMQSLLDRWNARRSTAVPPQLIGRIAPTRTEGINLRGVFTFPIEQYQAQLLPSLPAAKSRAFGG
jgi:hypothetical protein